MLLQADIAGIMWQMRANESLLTNVEGELNPKIKFVLFERTLVK